MDCFFLDQNGSLICNDEVEENEARLMAERLAAEYQTKVTVLVHAFEVPRPYCGCGEAMEMGEYSPICPTCDTAPEIASPLDWRHRPAVDHLMARHSIDRETAADMYRMKD